MRSWPENNHSVKLTATMCLIYFTYHVIRHSNLQTLFQPHPQSLIGSEKSVGTKLTLFGYIYTWHFMSEA